VTACSLGCVVMLPADMMQEILILWQSHCWTHVQPVWYGAPTLCLGWSLFWTHLERHCWLQS
jgi:hypothetical protein